MNREKNKYTVRFEPGSQDYAIYNGETVAYRGYETKFEADHDLDEILDKEWGEDQPATKEDFETFFKTTFGSLK
jgi:hypothetical protein